jgi:hypothetical protein
VHEVGDIIKLNDKQCSYLKPLESKISFYFEPNEFGAPDNEAAN